MTKQEAKWKFNRVAADASQLQSFVYGLIDGEVPIEGGSSGGGSESIIIDLETKLGPSPQPLSPSPFEPSADEQQVIDKLLPLFDVKQETIVKDGAEGDPEVIDRIYLKTPAEIFLYAKSSSNVYSLGSEMEESKFYTNLQINLVSGVVTENEQSLSAAMVELIGTECFNYYQARLGFLLIYMPISPTEKQLIMRSIQACISYSGE